MVLEDDDRASRSSSAMDESMGSDDSDVEQLPESEEPMDLVGDSTVPTPDIAESTAQKSLDTPESFEAMQVDQPNIENPPSRKSSVSSDAYEPPEPEASGESDRAYSPPDSVEPLAVEPQGGNTTEPVDQQVPDNRDETATELMITEVGPPPSPLLATTNIPTMLLHSRTKIRPSRTGIMSPMKAL